MGGNGLAEFLCEGCGASREFTDIDLCLHCAGAKVLESAAAANWIKSKIEFATKTATEALEAADPVWFSRLLRRLDEQALVRDGPALKSRHLLFSVIETIVATRPVITKRSDGREPPSPEKFLADAEQIGRLRSLEFALLEGNVALVDVSQQLVSLARLWPSGPPFPLARAERIWKSYTRMHFGAGRIAEQEPALWKSLQAGEPDSTLGRLAAVRGFKLPQFESHYYRVFFKIHAPTMHKALDDSPAGLAGALHDFCADAEKLADFDPEEPPFRKATLVPNRIFRRWLDRHSHRQIAPAVVMLTVPTRNRVLCPVAVQAPGGFVVLPNISLFFRSNIVNFSETPEGIEASKAASLVFELLVGSLLKENGWTVGTDDAATVGVRLSRKNPMELDVFAWAASQALAVEVKYELEPPGAWSDKNVEARRGQLTKFWSKLQGKASGWSDALEANPVTVTNWEGKRIRLPAPLQGTEVQPLLISARVEPRLEGANVVSLIPAKAAAVMRRYLARESFADWWDGHGPLPVQ